MMNICSNSEEQSDPMLNEYHQVADSVREARRYNRQEIGKLGCSKPTLNSDGNGSFTSPIPGSDMTPTARARFARPAQDPDSNAHETSAPRSGSAHLRVKNSNDQAPAPSVTSKVSTKSSKGKGEAQISQSRGDGRTSELNSQRSLTSDLPEEEQAQLDQRLAKLKRTGEARKGQPRSDGKTSDPASQRLLLSEAPDEEMVQADKSTTELSERRHFAQLHLPAPFLTVTLLTRGYFEVLFEKEEGARAARKLAVVEWSGWALSFSRYSALFRPNEHGAEMLLTHSIKVQFPDCHVQLRTEKALTIMASSIGDVLDIESPDSYIKRPAGPMVTVEVKDISKLAEIVRIPSMVEGAGPGDTTAQRILYSRLLNQCQKCRKFGHLAKICPLNRCPTQDGGIPAKTPSEWRGRSDRGKNTSAQRWSSQKIRRAMGQQDNGGTRSGKDDPNKGERTGRKPHNSVNLPHTASKSLATNGEKEKEKKLAPPSPLSRAPELDQNMFECTVSPPHRLTREQQESTPRTRLSFATSELASSPGNGNIANLNPFAGNFGEAGRTDLLQRQLEDPGEGWTFQGKRSFPVRILSPRQDPIEASTRSPQPATTPGGKRG
ncbi:unnamed protein product [Sphagnum jensenii]|uniref:CCHC-type domain-containing protein n=1 Tax=Sphagnum jensenii TaxID=128206 RepID=A0ABP0VJZ1_9BRYO